MGIGTLMPWVAVMVVLSLSSVLGKGGQPESISETLAYCLEQTCSPAYRHAGGLQFGLGLFDDVVSLLNLGGPALVCSLCELRRLIQAGERMLKSKKPRKLRSEIRAISREARKYELGEVMYYWVLAWNAIIWQFFFLGVIGVIFCASSLFSGILIAVLLPIKEVLAVIFYHEKFTAEKGISLALSLWGFVSYFYGEFKAIRRKKNQTPELLTPTSSSTT